MNTQTKKCPMCAEQIPLDATVCEYCGTKFDVTVEEGQTVSRFTEESAALPTPPAQLIPSPKFTPASKRTSPWAWIASGLALILILALVGGGILIAQNDLPFLATPTNTPRPTNTKRPTSTPNRIATQQRQNADATATAQLSWVQGFAQPILNDVHNRQPNFEDDFSVPSGRFDRWSHLSPGATFTDGVLRINTTGRDDVDVGGSLNALDFVLEFEFTPRINIGGSCAYANFRWGDDGGYGFNFNLNDNWRGMLTIPNGKSVNFVVEVWSDEPMPTRRTLVTIIAKGNRFAFFADGNPLVYAEDSTFRGTWGGLGVWSPSGTAEVDFDNVKFWDLNNQLP